MRKEVAYGDKLCLVGDASALGKWKLRKAAELRWGDGHVWSADVDLPDNEEVEFKVVNVRGSGDAEWEGGSNRKIRLQANHLEVLMKWSRTENSSVTEVGTSQPAAAPVDHFAAEQNGVGGTRADRSGEEGSSGDGTSGEEHSLLPQNAWQGRGVQFMKENRHSKERSGTWNTEGLDGVLRDLVAGDKEAGSWLQKLELAKDIVVERSENMQPDTASLAAAYIYLQWIATGSIPCVEGGGHYRPNRHAALGKLMFRSLEWVAGDGTRCDVDRMTARRMQAKLPSFSEAFTASVPLTRIRDIAHRNDIPQDLKRELKHTLQNKLHRNAGPEDLVATEEMLRRVTAPGADFSMSFVEEFKVFAAELRDFFNAGGLEETLEGVRPSLDGAGAAEVDRFLAAKAELARRGDGATLDDITACLHALTSVRSLIVAGLASGLRNDAPDEAIAMRQRWRLADLRSEDFAFVLLSRAAGAISAAGGAAALAAAHERAWEQPLMATVLALRHCGLSSWQPEECHALDEELTTWLKAGLTQSNDDALRLRASLERCQRLTDSYAEAQLEAFAGKAKQLGSALGIRPEVHSIFAESEIRASPIFQLSKVSTELLGAVRLVLGTGDMDALVLGTARGTLVPVDSIAPGMPLAGGKPCVLLVKAATGDEEITTAGEGIEGVVLCQDLPHLSHLGVRARQERVPFATCISAAASADFANLAGRVVELRVGAEAVTLVEVDGSGTGDTPERAEGTEGDPTAATPAGTISAERVRSAHVLPLAKAAPELCGSKAAGCARLAALAAGSSKRDAGLQFRAPAGAVLPFGCMELAVKDAGAFALFSRLRDALDTTPEGLALDAAVGEMAEVLEGCPPDGALLNELQAALGDAALASGVIVRSSANAEDLAGLSGAGLYESIADVPAGDCKALGAAVATVWASLFSRRAVLSRRAAGIAQRDACMAILVQELVTPEVSFVLHTSDPLRGENGAPDPGSVYAELAPGQGETLASGTAGSAWRMSIDKASKRVQTYAFANFSRACLPAVGIAERAVSQSIYSKSKVSSIGKLAMRTVNYSKQPLSLSSEKREELGSKLAALGTALADEFGGAQDIEGGLVGDDIIIVQSRPQP